MRSLLKNLAALAFSVWLIWFSLTWYSDKTLERDALEAFEQRLSQGGATLVSSNVTIGTNHGLPAARILYTAQCRGGGEYQGEAIGTEQGSGLNVRFEWGMNVTPEQVC